MKTGLDQLGLHADPAGLAGLRQAARADDPEAVEAVARQFEAIFVQTMLQTMRQAGFEGGLFDSSEMEFYLSLFDRQIAGEMTRQRSLGLADLLVRQLSPESAPTQRPESDQGFAVPQRRDVSTAAVVPAPKPVAGPVPRATTFTVPEPRLTRQAEPAPQLTPSVNRTDGFSGREEFVATMRPLAQRAAAQLDVPAEAIVAQAALETGWGRHMLKDAAGRPAWNLFGIKAGPDWDGPTISAGTLEVIDGEVVRETARFRAYASPAESVQDYVRFLSTRSRYAQVLEAGQDATRFAHGLQQAGYATDPEYANKIVQLVEQLRRADS